MLTVGDIRGIRRQLDLLLPNTATIQRSTTENVGGEPTQTWNDLATVKARITFIRGGESGDVGGRINQETTHLVTVPAKTDVEEADRIIVDDTTYEVTLVRKRGQWELSRRVEVKEAVS